MRRRAQKKWRFSETWLAKWLRFRPRIQERYCPRCNRPYVESPEPEPLKQFISVSTSALVYPIRRAGRKHFVVRVGRWQSYQNRLWLSQLLDAEDLNDLETVTASARDFIEAQKAEERRQGSRSAQR